MPKLLTVLLGLMTVHLVSAPARAQDDAAEFYKGKTVRLIVGAAAGAAYDFVGRAIAPHFGRYIPGNPNVIVENIPGAAGIIMLNQLYNRSPRDGTAMGMPLSGIMLEKRLKALSRDGSNVHFDISRMSFIGTPAQQPQGFIVWHRTPYRTFADIKGAPLTFGTTSPGTDSNVLPMMSNQLHGTQIKVVSGYKGATDAMLAVERGEADGLCTSLNGIVSTKPEWLNPAEANLILQIGLEPNPEMTRLKVPSAWSFVSPENRPFLVDEPV